MQGGGITGVLIFHNFCVCVLVDCLYNFKKGK